METAECERQREELSGLLISEVESEVSVHERFMQFARHPHQPGFGTLVFLLAAASDDSEETFCPPPILLIRRVGGCFTLAASGRP